MLHIIYTGRAMRLKPLGCLILRVLIGLLLGYLINRVFKANNLTELTSEEIMRHLE